MCLYTWRVVEGQFSSNLLFESLDWVRWFTRRRPQHFVSQLCAQRTRITLPTSVKLLKQTTMRDLMRSENIGEEESWDRNLRQPSLSLKRPRSRRWKSNLYKLLPECNKICAVKSLQIFCVFFFTFHKILWVELQSVVSSLGIPVKQNASKQSKQWLKQVPLDYKSGFLTAVLSCPAASSSSCVRLSCKHF